jgi:biotin carboxyl carrier protein
VGRTAQYITLPMGTVISTIPLKISQKREEIGLSPDISLDQQDNFFQNLTWETAKAVLVKSPMPGRLVHMNVRQGQRVLAGDPVATIECMKMYMNIVAESHGEIRDVFFRAGDMVGNASDLIRLLPTSPDWEGITQEKILENKDFLISLFPWAAKAVSKSLRKPFSNRARNRPPSKIFEDKNYLVLLYPWVTKPLLAPSSNPPPHKGVKSDMLTTLWASENNQQAFIPPAALPPSTQNSVTHDSDQHHKARRGNAKITYENIEKQPSIWQGSKASFQQQELGRDEFKDASGISAVAWVHWFCGLVVLSKLVLALKSLSCHLLMRVRLKKYAFIVSAFPKTAYLYANNCNNYPLVKNKTAHNRNRRYFARWKVAS